MSEINESKNSNVESAFKHQAERRKTAVPHEAFGSNLNRMDPPAKRVKIDTSTKLRRLMMFTNFPVELKGDTTVAREIRRAGTGYPWKMLKTLISQFHEERVKNNMVHKELHWEDQEDAFSEEISI